jgi:hypothetical protein
MENLDADLYAFLPVFCKVDKFIGMKSILNTSYRNERKTRVPTSVPSPDVLLFSRTETARTFAICLCFLTHY